MPARADVPRLAPVHQAFTRALDALVAQIRQDRTILAAILCGSLAHDTVWARSDIDLVEAAVRPDVGHGDDEARHLVAGVHGLCERTGARDTGVVAVAEDPLDKLLGVAAAAELLGALDGVRLRVALVIEVVEQAGAAPGLELLARDPEPVLAVPRHRRLDSEAVAPQGVRCRPLGEEGPGIGASRHAPRVLDRGCLPVRTRWRVAHRAGRS